MAAKKRGSSDKKSQESVAKSKAGAAKPPVEKDPQGGREGAELAKPAKKAAKKQSPAATKAAPRAEAPAAIPVASSATPKRAAKKEASKPVSAPPQPSRPVTALEAIARMSRDDDEREAPVRSEGNREKDSAGASEAPPKDSRAVRKIPGPSTGPVKKIKMTALKPKAATPDTAEPVAKRSIGPVPVPVAAKEAGPVPVPVAAKEAGPAPAKSQPVTPAAGKEVSPASVKSPPVAPAAAKEAGSAPAKSQPVTPVASKEVAPAVARPQPVPPAPSIVRPAVGEAERKVSASPAALASPPAAAPSSFPAAPRDLGGAKRKGVATAIPGSGSSAALPAVGGARVAEGKASSHEERSPEGVPGLPPPVAPQLVVEKGLARPKKGRATFSPEVVHAPAPLDRETPRAKPVTPEASQAAALGPSGPPAVRVAPPRKKGGAEVRKLAAAKAGPVPGLAEFEEAGADPLQAKAETLPPKPAAVVQEVVPHQGPEPVPCGVIDRGAPIPEQYGMDRLVGLPRDPQWAFCYWELSGGLLEKVRADRTPGFVDRCAFVLRLHHLDQDLAVDMEIDMSIGNWYVQVGQSGRYQFELGLLSPDGEWISLLASQVFGTPAERPSLVFDEEWRLPPDEEEELQRLLLQELGLEADGSRRGTSGFVGASVLPSSWRLPFSFAGASWGGSLSGRAVSGSWVSSFQGASGFLPSSPVGASAGQALGWLLGADGHHEPMLVRPGRNGGPNWHHQENLRGLGNAKSAQPGFKVRLPRVIHGVQRPAPNWPPARPGVTVGSERPARKKPTAAGKGR